MAQDSCLAGVGIVGVDVGRYQHQAACFSADGQLQWERGVANRLPALLAFVQELAAAPQPLVVAVEMEDDNAAALLRLLHAHGLRVLTCPPHAVKCFRRSILGEDKTDKIDARTIAAFARAGGRVHQAVDHSVPGRDALRVLSREAERLSEQSVALQNRLQALLVGWLPDVVTGGYFSSPSCPTALRFYRKYLPVARLRQAPPDELADDLRRWSRRHVPPHAAQELIRAAQLQPLSPAEDDACHQALLHLLDTLDQTQRQLKALQARLEEAVTEDPAGPALLAEDGIGPRIASTLLGEIPTIHAFTSEAAFARYGGVTPKRDSSGRREGKPRLCRHTNKRLLNAFYRSAVAAVAKGGRDAQYYQRKRRERPGTRKSSSFIALARKRARHLFRLLARHEPRPLTPSGATAGFIALGAVGTRDRDTQAPCRVRQEARAVQPPAGARVAPLRSSILLQATPTSRPAPAAPAASV